MRLGRASRTAEQNALLRSLDERRSSTRVARGDPLAHHFLGARFAALSRAARWRPVGWLIRTAIDRRWPGVRTSVIARTALIDQAIEAELAARPAQVVILGAGFDSRPLRLPLVRSVDVFEVDHPDTQAAKRAALDRAGLQLGDRHRFIATDFQLDELRAQMLGAGFDEAARAVIVWEGVSNYLAADAVDATLRWCARCPPGSLLIFTYVHRDVLDQPERYVGGRRLRATLDKVDEPITFGIDPVELPASLAERGLRLERDVGAAEYRRHHYGRSADRMKGHEFYRVAFARVV